MAENNVLRWGIVGAGLISFDFSNALDSLPKQEHQIVAVAARNIEKALEFAKQFQIPKAYGSYEELSRDQNIDIVYIGTIHTRHFELTKLMLEAGKHVLCEKPMSMSYEEALEVVELSAAKRRFFMEGFWSRCFPAYDKLREHLATPSIIGEVRNVQVTFGVPISQVERLRNPKLGGGGLLDIGCYTIQFASLVFNEEPVKIFSSGTLSETGVDLYGTILLEYSNKRSAFLAYNTEILMKSSAYVNGTSGSIEIPSFWNPQSLITRVKDQEETEDFPVPTCPRPMNYTRSECFVYEATRIRQSIINGKTECEYMTHQHSLWNMKIIDHVKKSFEKQI